MENNYFIGIFSLYFSHTTIEIIKTEIFAIFFNYKIINNTVV